MNQLLRLAAFAARVLPAPVKRAIYTMRPLARLVRGALNRAAPDGLSQVQVAAGGLQGMTVVLDMQTEKDYWLGTYEPELQQAVTDLVQPGMVIYDVGANVGYISLLLARAAAEKGRVFAFEALPDNIARIRRNAALNRMEARITPIHAAVVERAGPVRFLVHPSNAMGKAVGSAGREHPEEYLREIEVPGLTLDEFAYAQGNPLPQVVKMDIEGGEVLAVQGMQRLLAQVRPLLLIELHGQAAASAVWHSLMQHGYTVQRMQPGRPLVRSLDELGWKSYLIASSGEEIAPRRLPDAGL